MSEAQPSSLDDEIDLRELFSTLWRGKWVVAIVCIIAIFAASVYLHHAKRLYTVELTLQPASKENASPNLGSLGGLASLAGVQLPTGGSSDFSAFAFMLTSQEVSAQLSTDMRIMLPFFGAEWDREKQIWRAREKSALSERIGNIKRLLTGSEVPEYRAPDAMRLAESLSELISQRDDKNSGFLILSVQVEEPDFAEFLLLRMVEETNILMRRRFLETSADSLSFYQTQIARARSSEHREALAKLIAAEEQRLMLANRGSAFAAEIVSGPKASLYPTSPKARLVLALALVLGLFLGAALVLIRAAIRSPKG